MPGTVAVNLRQMPMSRTLPRAMPELRCARRAVRCLFDRVDHEQLQRDLEEEKRARVARFTEAYNFDLSTETPLPGRFEWQSVGEETAAAAASRASEAGDAVVASETEDAEPPAIAQRPQRPVLPARQRRISEFFQMRKGVPPAEKTGQQPPAKMARLMPEPESVP
uniref:Cyclin-dependent kinase inhibitor 1B n=1 Tax=Rhipicephalus appendiculatus TaxID=34631 RepID=A0A131Z0G7_RHIAP